MIRLLISGSRSIDDVLYIFRVLDKIHKTYVIDTMITGMADGVDTVGWWWADVNQFKKAEYPVSKEDWEACPRLAGFIRNQKMLDAGCPTYGLLFNDVRKNPRGTSGTNDMKERLELSKIPFRELLYKGEHS